MLCKVSIVDGCEVLSLIFSVCDFVFILICMLCQEKGGFVGELMYWYQLDLGGQKLLGYDICCVVVVKFDKNCYVQIVLYVDNVQELGMLQLFI